MLCAKYNLQSERTFETPCTCIRMHTYIHAYTHTYYKIIIIIIIIINYVLVVLKQFARCDILTFFFLRITVILTKELIVFLSCPAMFQKLAAIHNCANLGPGRKKKVQTNRTINHRTSSLHTGISEFVPIEPLDSLKCNFAFVVDFWIFRS